MEQYNSNIANGNLQTETQRQIEFRVVVDTVVFFDEEQLSRFIGKIREIENEHNCRCTHIEARF